MATDDRNVVNSKSGAKKILSFFTQSKTPIASLIIIYALMVLIFSLSSPYYLTLTNFKDIFNNLAVFGIL